MTMNDIYFIGFITAPARVEFLPELKPPVTHKTDEAKASWIAQQYELQRQEAKDYPGIATVVQIAVYHNGAKAFTAALADRPPGTVALEFWDWLNHTRHNVDDRWPRLCGFRLLNFIRIATLDAMLANKDGGRLFIPTAYRHGSPDLLTDPYEALVGRDVPWPEARRQRLSLAQVIAMFLSKGISEEALYTDPMQQVTLADDLMARCLFN